MNGPDLHVEVDRTRAARIRPDAAGRREQPVRVAVSSAQVQPNYWLDPRDGHHVRGRRANAAVPARFGSDDGEHAHRRCATGGRPQLLSNVATVKRRVTPVVANHPNVQPVFDVYANVQDSDLGSVAAQDRQHRGGASGSKLAPGNEIVVRGQVESMESAFTRLGLGLVFAAVLVYLLMVVNFQSWIDPFIIITALPGAFTGIVWTLFLTQTTFSVPALMGAIM